MEKQLPPIENVVLTRQQVRNCDQVAIDRYGIPGMVLMENAGSAAARQILAQLPDPTAARVVVLAGTGNNGGDGYVLARHLFNQGVSVNTLILASRDRIKGDALANLNIIEKMELPIQWLTFSSPPDVEQKLQQCLESADWVIDAMLGTGTAGSPREPIRTAIATLNRMTKKVLALDIPSGLDCDTGMPLELAVKATQTITFAALKKGFQTPQHTDYTGPITVASIGIHTHLLK